MFANIIFHSVVHDPFSKIPMKLDKKDVYFLGLQLSASFTSLLLNTGVTLHNLSLKGYFSNVTVILNISERKGAMILLAHLNHFMGYDHRP